MNVGTRMTMRTPSLVSLHVPHDVLPCTDNICCSLFIYLQVRIFLEYDGEPIMTTLKSTFVDTYTSNYSLK